MTLRVLRAFVVNLPFLLLLAPCATMCEETGLRFWGALQSDLIAVQTFGRPVRDQFDFTGMSTLTLNAKNRDTRFVKVEGSVDLVMLYGQAADALRLRMAPLGSTQISGESFLLVDVRKLYASLFWKYADVSVGRQIVNLGTGTVFSPIDVFTTVNIADLAFKRSGSNVARVRVPLGDVAGIDAMAKLASRSQGATGAIKAYAALRGFDLAATGIYRGDQDAIYSGLTFKGDAVIGVRGELVERWNLHGDPWFLGMGGADYSIAKTWFFDAEYLYTQHPEADSSALWVSVFGGSLSGKHSGYASVRCAINDLMGVGLAVVADIGNQAGFGTAQFDWDALQNARLLIYARLPFGMEDVPGIEMPDAYYGARVEVAF